jgi:hypothetical protein
MSMLKQIVALCIDANLLMNYDANIDTMFSDHCAISATLTHPKTDFGKTIKGY